MSSNFEVEEQEVAPPPLAAASISPTQRTPQTSPQSSTPNDPTYLLTAAAYSLSATMESEGSNTGNNDGNEAINVTNESQSHETGTPNTNAAAAPAAAASAAPAATETSATSAMDVTEQTTFDALTHKVWWRRTSNFARSDALALLPTLDDENPYNLLFVDLMGDELQNLVPHAIELIQGILHIADHNWRSPQQIPPTTDLSALPGMYHLMHHHQDLLELHADRKYKLPIGKGAGGGGGGDDKGSGDDGGDDSSVDDNEEDDVDPYDTDKTDKTYDVTPPDDEQAKKWEKALLKKRAARKTIKQWDVIRIVWDGLLHCYETQIRDLREYHLQTRNKARRITQAMAELKKGNINEEEVCYILSAIIALTENNTNHFWYTVQTMLVLRATVQTSSECHGKEECSKRLVHPLQESCKENGRLLQGQGCHQCIQSCR